MSKQKLTGIVITVVLLLILAGNIFFIVNETEQVIVTQFGRPIGDAITQPGLKIKVPFIREVNRFDKRFLEWDGEANQIPTKDKRYIKVDTYGRWQITDPLLFFKRLKDERGAQSRIDDILDGETRNVVASYDLIELIRSTDFIASKEEIIVTDDMDDRIKITKGRRELALLVLSNSQPRTKELGIKLLDVQFKRINYVSEVENKIFERMISERKRIAEKYRSEGKGKASKILGDKERELKRILSDGYRQAEEIKGDGDARAAAIYANAYNRNADTRDFYKFLKTMDTYEKTFSQKDWMVLSTKGEFLKYLETSSGK